MQIQRKRTADAHDTIIIVRVGILVLREPLWEPEIMALFEPVKNVWSL